MAENGTGAQRAAVHPGTRRSTPRRALLLAGAVLVAAFGVLAPASPASAHAVLVETVPDSGAVVQTAPDSVALTFNEPIRLVTRDFSVVAPNGRNVQHGDPHLTGDGSMVEIPLDKGLPRGTFLVSYRIISADSHPVAGGFSFSLGAPSKTAAATSGGSDAAEDPVVAAAMPVARYLGFAGLVLLVGPTLFLMSMWPRRLSRGGPAKVIWLGVALVGVASLAELYLEVPYSTGGGLLSASYPDFIGTMNSRFGWAHLARLIQLAASVPLLAIVTSSRRNTLAVGEKIALALMTAVGLLSWGFGGHPSTAHAPILTVLADGVHLGAMSVWLGGLLMLFGFLLRRARPAELVAVLPVWSRLAGWLVGLLAVTGIVQASMQLGSVDALVSSTYGALIITKAVIFSLILGTAYFSRRAVRRAVLGA
ncbi:MAG: copper resistance protein CopC, partial [Actinocatenispora sp.]